MPDRKRPAERRAGDRTPAQREADHGSIGRLSETLLPALVEKLAASGLGELEVHEGSWRVRLRRPPSAAAAGRRTDRTRPPSHVDREGRSARDGVTGGSAARPELRTGAPAAASAEDRPEADGAGQMDAFDDDPYATDDPPRSVATSPTVGLFRPDVPVGTWVQTGDRVGVVDLLGIPQDVPSPIDGTLVEVFPASGEAVEFGEAIAAVAPDPPNTAAGDQDADAASNGVATATEGAADEPVAGAERG